MSGGRIDPLLVVGQAFSDADNALQAARTDVERDHIQTEWSKIVMAAAKLRASNAVGRRIKAAMLLTIVDRIGDTANRLFGDLAVSLASDILSGGRA